MSDCLTALKERTPFCWLNPDYGKSAELPYSIADVYDAEARLARFAPLMAELFEAECKQYESEVKIVNDVLDSAPTMAEVGVNQLY